MAVTHRLSAPILPMFLVAALMCVACSAVADPPAPGAKASQQATSLEPAEIRTFLAQAKSADRIADPLARCLAFPDLPGNHWPTGLTQAQCHFQFDPRITPELIRQYLDRGATVELDALFSRDLARHFSETHFSEAIHLDFEAIDASEKSNSLTLRWLKMAPDSAFAQTARARYFRRKALKVRGEDYAANTSVADMQSMSVYSDNAIALYRQALKTEPRMMPAYAGLITMGMFASRPDVVESAFEKSMVVDPGCRSVNDALMITLRPEWGGSDKALQDFSEKLAAQSDKRPLLVLIATKPDQFQIDDLYNAGKFEESMQLGSAASLRSSDPEVIDGYANAANEAAPGANRWRVLMYLLEETRFQVPAAWGSFALDQGFDSTLHDQAWAVSFLEGTVAREPRNGYVQCLLATRYEKLNRPAEAEQHFLLGVADADGGAPSVLGLMRLAQQQKQIEKARHYYQMLELAYPNYLERFYIPPP